MKPEENKFADVPVRVRTWVYIIVVFAIGIYNPLATKILISWITFQCFFEFSRMFKIESNQLIPSIFICVLQFLILYFLDKETYFISSLILTFIIILYFLFLKVQTNQLKGIFVSLIVCLFSFPHLVFIREMTTGIQLVIFAVVVTELNDVFQYLMGKFFGKHKIVPKISPNKTLEGFIGGSLLTILLSNILGLLLLNSNILTNTILGIILGISGFCGDILMSYLKRRTNVKDTGDLLPGHGGLLDRMDSLIFNAPIFFWILPFILKN